MFYPYVVKQEDGQYISRLRDLDFFAVGETEDQAVSLMKDGFMQALDERFRKNKLPIPMPSKPIKGKDSLLYVDIRDEARILLWNELLKQKVSLAELGRKMGLSRQEAHRLITGAFPVSIDRYCKAFEALGFYLSLELNQFK